MQQSLFPEHKRNTEHGGSLGKGKRKTRRAIALKRPMHLVLKSDIAKGDLSLLKRRNARYVAETVPALAKRYGVNVYEFANAGNHLHLAVKAKDRRGFQNFLRVLGSKVAIFVCGAKKGNATGEFWTYAPYTRIVEWGMALRRLVTYIAKNESSLRLSSRTFLFPPSPCEELPPRIRER